MDTLEHSSLVFAIVALMDAEHAAKFAAVLLALLRATPKLLDLHGILALPELPSVSFTHRPTSDTFSSASLLSHSLALCMPLSVELSVKDMEFRSAAALKIGSQPLSALLVPFARSSTRWLCTESAWVFFKSLNIILSGSRIFDLDDVQSWFKMCF